ncbi:MAG: 23S rRNA (guanosine(2251)-2'-O)-methyltransferase RlmB [Anaerolineales bacterium]|nr:23S rRNA (guanosine(2251)-2'-O)-methyltransferase RlmB [Anaerolineales bacterium]
MREWISGRNPVYEVLRAGRRHSFRLQLAQGVQEKGRLRAILDLCQKSKLPVESVPRQQLDGYGDNHQGVALETSAYSYSSLQEIFALAQRRNEPPFLLVLDALQDPQNLGTLLRTAEGVGVHGVVLPLRHTATVTPAVVNASSGASEHLLITQHNLAQAITMMKDQGVWVVGLAGVEQAQTLNQVRLDGPIALVIGSEGQGMRQLVRDSCDVLLQLPMRGKVESLNAAVAGSVALYLAWQARGF